MRSNPIDMVLICTLFFLCHVQGQIEVGDPVDTSPNVEHVAGPGLSQAGSPVYSITNPTIVANMQGGVTISAVDSTPISYPEAACSTCEVNSYFICKNLPFSSTDRLFATDANGYPTNVPVSSFHWKRSGDDLMCNNHHTNNFMINNWGCTFKVQKHHNPGSFTITITGYFRLGMDQLEYDSGVNGYPSNVGNCIPSNPSTTYSGMHGDTIVEADPNGNRYCQYGSSNWYRTERIGFPGEPYHQETILTSSWEDRQSWYINDYLFSSDSNDYYSYNYRAEKSDWAVAQFVDGVYVEDAFIHVVEKRIPRCDTNNTIMIRNQFLVGCAGSYQGFCVPCGRYFPEIPDKSVPVAIARSECQTICDGCTRNQNPWPTDPECICAAGKYLKDCGINRFLPPTHKFEYCLGAHCNDATYGSDGFQDYSTTSTSITNAGHCADCVSCPEGWYIPAEWAKCNQQGNGDIYRHPIYGLNNINGPNMCKSCLTNGIATCAVNEYHTCGLDSAGTDAGQCASCDYCPSGQYANGCGLHDGVGSLPEGLTYLNSNNENMYAWDVSLQDVKGSRDWPTAHSAKGTCTACASCSSGTRVGCSGNSPGTCRTDDSSDATYQVTGGTRNCMTTTSVITASVSMDYVDIGSIGGGNHHADAYGTPVSDGCDTLNAQVHPDWTGYYETTEPCMAFDTMCLMMWQNSGFITVLYYRMTPHVTEGQDCVCGSNQYWAGCYSDGSDPGQCKDCDDCPTNQYKTGCGGLNAGTCQACNPSSCSANHYLVGCGGLSAGTCTACPGCPINQERIGCSRTYSQGSCNPCGSAEYKDTDTNAACQACPGCPAGQYNTACQTCAATESGFFSTSTAYGGQVNCMMSTTAASCTQGQELIGCSGSSSGSCNNCGSEEFNPVAGGGQCTPCSSACASDQYESISCTTTTNRECTNCVSCGIGQYRSGCGGINAGSCENCPSDEYNDGSSNSECTACTPACGSEYYASVACTSTTNRVCSACTSACGSGFWESTACTATTNRVCTACLLCPPGSTMTGCSGSSAGVCKADPGYSGGDIGGFDATTFNSLNCATPGTCGSYQACSPGTYKPNSGDSPCEPCPTCLENQYLSACDPITGGTCQDCPAGYSSPPGSLQSSDCTLCHESTVNNPTSCDNLCQAPAGYIINSNGNLLRCPEGTYNSGSTFLTCTDCPTGKTSKPGSTAESDCECKKGFFLSSSTSTCSACQPGTYKEYHGNHACTDCPASSTSLHSGADDIVDCLCLPDYEPDWRGDCQPCRIRSMNDPGTAHYTGGPNQTPWFQFMVCGGSRRDPPGKGCETSPHSVGISGFTGYMRIDDFSGYDVTVDGTTYNVDPRYSISYILVDDPGCVLTIENYTYTRTDESVTGLFMDCWVDDSLNPEVSIKNNAGSPLCWQSGENISASERTIACDYNNETESWCEIVSTFTSNCGLEPLYEITLPLNNSYDPPEYATCRHDSRFGETAPIVLSAAPPQHRQLLQIATYQGFSFFEMHWKVQCPSSFKYVTSDELCIECGDHQTLSPDLPHQQSSCLCDEGFTGTHLGCTPCPKGSYKDTKGSTECTSCADHATTPTTASTNISECACEGPMWIPSQTGPDEVDGSCQAACGPGETVQNFVCIPCSEGTYKSVQGLEACTECADPRNSSPPGATNAGHCSCPKGQIALGGNFVEIVSVGNLTDVSTVDCGSSSQACTIDMQANQRLGSVELTGSGHQHISITTNGVKVFVCTTDCDKFLGEPIRLAPITGNTQISITSGQLTLSLYNGREAVFSESAPWMNGNKARSLIMSRRLRPGDVILDSTSLVLTPNACIECIKGMICKQYITEWVTECPAGKYTELGLKCSNCEAGKSSPAGSQYSTDCVSCPAGKSAGVGQECSQCPAGKFADSGQGCTNCAEGKSSPAGSLYSSDCVNCTAGQSAAAGQVCTECPAGKYAEAGQVCSNCTAGMSSPAGSQYSTDCVNCLAGKYSLSGNCTDCTDNSKSAAGADSCTSCALGEVFYIQHENRDPMFFNFFQAGQKLTRGPDHQYGAYYTISPTLNFAGLWIDVYMYQTEPNYCWDYWDEYFGTLQECAFILSPGYPTRYAGFGTETDVTSEVFLQEWNSYINGDVRDECRDKKIY